MRDWAIETAARASKATGGTRLVLWVVAGHWTPSTGISRPGVRRVAELAACSRSEADRRLRRLVELGDLVVEERGRGQAATRYRIPALDDALERDGLTFPSDTTLQPRSVPPLDGTLTGVASRPTGDANYPDPLEVGLASRETSLASRERPALRGTEVRSNEVDLRARTRAREADRPHVDGGAVDLHYADEDERLRTSTLISGIRTGLAGKGRASRNGTSS